MGTGEGEDKGQGKGGVTCRSALLCWGLSGSLKTELSARPKRIGLVEWVLVPPRHAAREKNVRVQAFRFVQALTFLTPGMYPCSCPAHPINLVGVCHLRQDGATYTVFAEVPTSSHSLHTPF